MRRAADDRLSGLAFEYRRCASARTISSVAPLLDAAADTTLAPSLSEGLSKKLARSVHTSLNYSERYVDPYGGGHMEVVDDTFVLVAAEKDEPLDDAMNSVHETAQSLWHDPGWHRATQAAAVWTFSSRSDFTKFSKTREPTHLRPGDLSFYVPDHQYTPRNQRDLLLQ